MTGIAVGPDHMSNPFMVKDLNKLQFRLTLADVEKMTPQQQEYVREAMKGNLRFLSNCILRPNNLRKYPSLVENVHGQIIDHLLAPIPGQHLEDWTETEEFILLASRGMLKSTIGANLLTQIILNSPDVRILILSGKIDKSSSIMELARDPFYANEVVRYLFPGFAITDEHRQAETFTTPMRNAELLLRDPTIEVSSFDAVKAGWHGEIVLFDDATNEINSTTLENVEKTHAAYDATDPLLEPGGYRLFLGTKWHDEDLPEYIRRKGITEFEATGRTIYSYFYLPAWVLKQTGSDRDRVDRELREKQGLLTPADVIPTWPEKLKTATLFTMYRNNRVDFYKQYLLNASLEQQRSFTDDMMNNQIVAAGDWHSIPIFDRAVVIHWDFASVWSGRRKMSENDYSCGIVCIFQLSTGRMYVADATLAHFVSGDEMANAILRLYKSAAQMGPIIGHSLEDAVGVRNIESTVNRLAEEEGLDMMPLNFILPQKGAKGAGNVKNSNIAVLASAMRGPLDPVTKQYTLGMVFLASNLPHIDEIKVQFQKWSIDAKRRKDDAPDVIAQTWIIYRPQIRVAEVPLMQADEQILSWEEPPPVAQFDYDPHADERDNADTEYLSNDTVTFN